MGTRAQKIFVGGVELTKHMAITAFDFRTSAEGLAVGTIKFFVDEVSMDSDGNIVLGKADGKELEKINNVKFERSMVF